MDCMRIFLATIVHAPAGFEPGRFYWTREARPVKPESPGYPGVLAAFQSAIMNLPATETSERNP